MFKRQKKKTGSNVPTQATVPPMPEMNITGICQYETPEFRKPTPPLPPTSGSNAVKPNLNYVPLDSVKKSCHYELPCDWCTKWDKKCDTKYEQILKENQ